jgi:hypothetical protein
MMLGVRRAGVTDTLKQLKEDGAIILRRGMIFISNRPALEGIAGDAYGAPEEEYRRLIGGW